MVINEPIDICQSAFNRDMDGLKMAIQEGADVNVYVYDHLSVLEFVKDVECARMLVKAGIDVNSRSRDNAPSGEVAGGGWSVIEISRLLLDSGADANFKYRFGSLLFYAQTPEMVQLLVERGARVNARGYRRMTPLFFAKSVAVAEALIANGANVDAKDRHRITADEYRRQARYTDVADFIRAKREQKLLGGMVPLAAEGQTRRHKKYI